MRDGVHGGNPWLSKIRRCRPGLRSDIGTEGRGWHFCIVALTVSSVIILYIVGVISPSYIRYDS